MYFTTFDHVERYKAEKILSVYLLRRFCNGDFIADEELQEALQNDWYILQHLVEQFKNQIWNGGLYISKQVLSNNDIFHLMEVGTSRICIISKPGDNKVSIALTNSNKGVIRLSADKGTNQWVEIELMEGTINDINNLIQGCVHSVSQCNLTTNMS